MKRNLAVLGVAVVAVLAFAAVSASSALAFEDFLAQKELTSFRGLQSESVEFKLAGGTFICAPSGGVSNGLIQGMFTPEKQPTLETSDSAVGKGVEYGNCTYQGKAATFNSNHCNFRFHAEQRTLDVIKNGTVTEETECAANGMTFSSEGCVVRIKPEAKNEGLPSNPPPELYGLMMAPLPETEWFILIRPSYSKIKYTSSGKCVSNGTFENGEFLRGTLEVKGYTGTAFKARAGLWMK